MGDFVCRPVRLPASTLASPPHRLPGGGSTRRAGRPRPCGASTRPPHPTAKDQRGASRPTAKDQRGVPRPRDRAGHPLAPPGGDFARSGPPPPPTGGAPFPFMAMTTALRASRALLPIPTYPARDGALLAPRRGCWRRCGAGGAARRALPRRPACARDAVDAACGWDGGDGAGQPGRAAWIGWWRGHQRGHRAGRGRRARGTRRPTHGDRQTSEAGRRAKGPLLGEGRRRKRGAGVPRRRARRRLPQRFTALVVFLAADANTGCGRRRGVCSSNPAFAALVPASCAAGRHHLLARPPSAAVAAPGG